MPVGPLSDDDGTRIAAAYRLPLARHGIASFPVLARALLTSYHEVGCRYAEGLAEPPAHASGRPETRGTTPGQQADHPAAAPPWSRPVTQTWRSAATRAVRSGSRRRSAAWSGTSRRTAWSRTPARSRSR